MYTDLALAFHITLGVLALTLGPLALLAARRRGPVNVAATAYHWAVLGVCVSAAALVGADPGRLWWLLPIAAGSYALAPAGLPCRSSTGESGTSPPPPRPGRVLRRAGDRAPGGQRRLSPGVDRADPDRLAADHLGDPPSTDQSRRPVTRRLDGPRGPAVRGNGWSFFTCRTDSPPWPRAGRAPTTRAGRAGLRRQCSRRRRRGAVHARQIGHGIRGSSPSRGP